jgi:F-type H+-transporting ATPase subunit O
MCGVAGKYASTLYITAIWENAFEPVKAEELQQVCGAAETKPVFANFLKGPICFENNQGESSCGNFQEHQVQ